MRGPRLLGSWKEAPRGRLCAVSNESSQHPLRLSDGARTRGFLQRVTWVPVKMQISRFRNVPAKKPGACGAHSHRHAPEGGERCFLGPHLLLRMLQTLY